MDSRQFNGGPDDTPPYPQDAPEPWPRCEQCGTDIRPGNELNVLGAFTFCDDDCVHVWQAALVDRR